MHAAAYDLEELSQKESPVADLFRLERSRNWADVLVGVSCVREHVKPEEQELRRAFESFLAGAILPRLGVAPAEIPARLILEEFEPMLAESIDIWNQQLREESMQKGMQQGMQQGEQKGEAKALLLLLEKRFGAVDQGTRDRITKADSDLLLGWLDRFATATRLADVFDN